MILTKSSSKLFFKLYIPLLGYANTYDGNTKKRSMDTARRKLFENKEIIEAYVRNNPDKLSKENLEVISGWKKFVRSDFILIAASKKVSYLLDIRSKQPKCFAILGLTDPPETIAQCGLGTFFQQVVLLPFKGEIIWDGLTFQPPLVIGKNILWDAKETYKKIKREGGIIHEL